MSTFLFLNGPYLNPHGTREPEVRGALLAAAVPFTKVHLSNTFAREDFRQNNYFSDIAVSCLSGFGAYAEEE